MAMPKLPATVNPADPLAALLAAVVGLLSLPPMQVWTWLGMSGEEVGQLLAAVMTIAAVARTWLSAKRARVG